MSNAWRFISYGHTSNIPHSTSNHHHLGESGDHRHDAVDWTQLHHVLELLVHIPQGKQTLRATLWETVSIDWAVDISRAKTLCNPIISDLLEALHHLGLLIQNALACVRM